MITTSEKKHDEVLRMLRHHGSRQAYLHERVGRNSRLDEIQAALLRVKLRRLDEFNAARRRVAQRYRQTLKGVQPPVEDARGTHVYHQFTVRSDRRDVVREALARDGIAASIYYPTPLHRQPAYEAANRGASLPESEAAAKVVLSLPIHPMLDDGSVDRICARVEAALA
jgi:dTDP-4-amino-4,6-dideoxygalactose transaminase